MLEKLMQNAVFYLLTYFFYQDSLVFKDFSSQYESHVKEPKSAIQLYEVFYAPMK